MLPPWQKRKHASSKILIFLLAANGLLSGGILSLRFLLYSAVGNDPLSHLGLVLMHGLVAIWVVLSSTLASFAGVTGVVLGSLRRRHLTTALGHALIVVPHVLGLLWFLNLGGMFADRGVDIRRIAGTESADGSNPASGPALSLSPDEHWVTYWECYTESRGTESRSRLCSVDLTNDRRVVHSPDSLRTQSDGSRADWDDVAWGFDPGGWSGAKLFVDGHDLTAAVDPAQEFIVPCTVLPKYRMGSDGPSWRVVAGELSRRNMRTENFELERQSLVWASNGKPRELYYVQHLENDVDAIMCRDGDETREVLKKQDRYRFYTINQVRVSPDRTFVAYSANGHGKAHLGIPDYGSTVFIRHLPTGEEKRAGRHFRVSNLIWSADSERLYYAGSGFEGIGLNSTSTKRWAGVYCTNVASTFPPTKYSRVPPDPPEPTPDQMLASATGSWRRYVAPGGAFALRYPDRSIVLDERGEMLVLRHRASVLSNDSCPNEGERPDRFYAQIHMDYREIENIVESLTPTFRDGQWRLVPGQRRGVERIRLGSVHGMRLQGPAECEYTYVLPTGGDATLVITRAVRPEMERVRLAETMSALREAELPRGEDPTFAFILSSIEFNP
jgi:hypothetical protein